MPYNILIKACDIVTDDNSISFDVTEHRSDDIGLEQKSFAPLKQDEATALCLEIGQLILDGYRMRDLTRILIFVAKTKGKR
jgi:hypothetical protein